MRLISVMAVVAGLGATGCAARANVVPVPTPTLAEIIDSITTRPPLHRTSWGILVQDAATGSVLYSRNAEKHFIPASNTKLVIGVVAFGVLGPDYTYRTRVLESGRDADRAERVVLEGSGDPSWSERFHDDATAPLDSIATRIIASGVRSIGTLIADASRFEAELVNSTWEVGDLPGIYAPPVDALALADGTFDLIVRSGAAVGEAGVVEVARPLSQPVRGEIRTDTAGARVALSIDYTARRDTIYVTGSIGLGAVDTVTRAVTNPARTVVETLANILRERGVSVDSAMVVRDSSAAASVRAGTIAITEWQSPPMREIVSVILRPSQNWVAEQVVKTLGAEDGGDGSWRSGIQRELAYLYGPAGLDSGAVNLRDGSGMSAQNLLTPVATVAMLMHARAQPWSGAFRDALAAPGRPGTTLTSRLRPLEGRVFGKTGTISNVNSLSGYLVTADGRDIVFSILTNGSGLPSGTVRAAIDEVLLAVARTAGIPLMTDGAGGRQ